MLIECAPSEGLDNLDTIEIMKEQFVIEIPEEEIDTL